MAELAAIGVTMASAATAAAPYALAAGTALTATSQIIQSREQSKAAAFEADQLRTQEQQYRIAAAQDEARRRDELTSNLETIQAIRSGRGVGQASPTGTAILDSITADEERDIGISKLNYLQRADMSRRLAGMSEGRARTSLLAGYLGAGATAADSLFRYGAYGSGRHQVPAPRRA